MTCSRRSDWWESCEEFHNQVATELFEVVQDLEKTTGLATGMPYNCASFLLLQHNS